MRWRVLVALVVASTGALACGVALSLPDVLTLGGLVFGFSASLLMIVVEVLAQAAAAPEGRLLTRR